MVEQKINVEIVKDSRPSMGKFGMLLGKQIFTIEKVNVDLKYNSRLAEAQVKNLLMPSRPIVRYKVKAIDIVSIDTALDASNSPVVILNPGRIDANGNSLEIICPMVDPKFAAEVTVQSVAEAINKKNGGIVYFSNGKRLAEQANILNQKEISELSDFIDELKKQQNLVDNTITTNTNNIDEYYKELDGKSGTNVEARIHIEA